MILQDIFEPVQVKELLEQVTPVSIVPLNSQGLADYHWASVDGHTIQVERKQIDEILSDINHVEEQLGREITRADETILVWEGSYEPIAGLQPCCQSWRKSNRSDVMVPSRKYKLSYSMIQAWFYQLDKCGISSFNTSDYKATAIALGAWYNSSQVREHTTLHRYIKDHVNLKSAMKQSNTHTEPETINPNIYNLMALKGAGVGEVTARALIDKFGTFYYTISQDIPELAETIIGNKRFGETSARRLLKSVGRLK